MNKQIKLSPKKRILTILSFLTLGVVLNCFFINCSDSFKLEATNLTGQSIANSITPIDPTPVPKGPLPPVPPDVLPTAIKPAWFGTHAVNEWFAIPNSIHAGSAAAPLDNPNDVACSSTRRLAYSNIAQKGNQIVLAATGGHNDYSGNEVTSIDLGVDAPAWKLLKAATPDAQRVPNVPYFLDGLPNSRHTYNSVFFSTTHNRLILHRTRFMWNVATSSNDTNGFNLDTNNWDAAGSFNPGMTASARDSHDNVWATGNYFELYKWTATTDTWIKTGTFPNQIGSVMAHDSRRDQIYQLSWGDGQGNTSGIFSYVFDINGTTQTVITLQDSSAYRQFQADRPANATMVYDPEGDRFLYWDGLSGRLYQITPNSSTNWDMSILATTGTLPPAASSAYGRMAYVPALRGLVVMPSGHQNLYFIRLN